MPRSPNHVSTTDPDRTIPGNGELHHVFDHDKRLPAAGRTRKGRQTPGAPAFAVLNLFAIRALATTPGGGG
jgi:hypothetical protein